MPEAVRFMDASGVGVTWMVTLAVAALGLAPPSFSTVTARVVKFSVPL